MKSFFASVWKGLRRWLRGSRVIWHKAGESSLITIESKQTLPLVILIALLAWYLADPAPVSLISLVTLGGMMLVDGLWALSMARRVSAERRLRYSAMQVGDEMEELIILNNRSGLPVLWAEFVDRSNIPGYTVSSVRGADALSRVQWRAHTICTRRGLYRLGPWELRLGQPFGLLMVRQLYLQHQDILVYPQMAVLPDQILPHRGAMGDYRPLNQPYPAETITASSVRAYQPGDPLRHVHWPTTARRMDTFVKVFSPEAASRLWLVPDFYLPDHHQHDEYSSEEFMVTVAASLAAVLLAQHLRIGLFACAESDQVVLPRQGQAHLWSILKVLATLQSAPRMPLEDTLARAGSLIGGSDLLIVITPSLRPDWIAPLQRLARSRSASGRAEVILLDSPVPAVSEQAGRFYALLAERAIAVHLLASKDVQFISGYYGELSRWEFTVSATGRAMARSTPRAASPVISGQGAALWQPKRD